MIEDTIHNYFYSHGVQAPERAELVDRNESLCLGPTAPPHKHDHALYFLPRPENPGMHIRPREFNLGAVKKDGELCPFPREIVIHL